MGVGARVAVRTRPNKPRPFRSYGRPVSWALAVRHIRSTAIVDTRQYNEEEKESNIELPYKLNGFAIPYYVNEPDLKELFKKCVEGGPPDQVEGETRAGDRYFSVVRRTSRISKPCTFSRLHAQRLVPEHSR